MIGPYFACLPRGPPEADAPAAPQPLVALLLRVWHTCEFQSDAVIFLTFHYLIAIAPLLVWSVSVVARRLERWQREQAGSGGGRAAWASRGADLLTIAPMVYLHFRFLRVVTAVMGWWPLWFGPACGYVVPICLLIVRAGLAAFPVKP